MSEEQKEKQLEDYQFINEQIISKKKSKWKKRLGTAGFVVCMAALFGLVSSLVFVTSEGMLREWLGLESGQRQPIDLPKPSEGITPYTPTPTVKPVKATPVPTLTPEPTVEAQITEVPTVAVTGVPDLTAAPTEAPLTPEPTRAEEKPPLPTEPAENTGDNVNASQNMYLSMYEGVVAVAETVENSLVTIEAVEQGVDWFQETYETRTKTTGLILADDGIDLLILVDTERISGASFIEVYFEETVLEGRIYSLDKNYGLAVIAVPLSNIPEEIYTKIQPATLADESKLFVGTPVIALGAPNGYEGSMEFGMVTSLGSTVAVIDGEVPYFTTNIMEQASGYGFVLNLSGEFVGMITHTHKEDTSDGIFSAISLDAIRGVIEKLLNNERQAYFGIKGQNVPRKLLEENVLESGVYVSEVLNSSPALSAGIKAGDVIVSVGNIPVEGIRGFTDVLLERSTKEIVLVKLLRKVENEYREMTLEVVLEEKN